MIVNLIGGIGHTIYQIEKEAYLLVLYQYLGLDLAIGHLIKVQIDKNKSMSHQRCYKVLAVWSMICYCLIRC